jgi:hypothetical protein
LFQVQTIVLLWEQVEQVEPVTVTEVPEEIQHSMAQLLLPLEEAEETGEVTAQAEPERHQVPAVLLIPVVMEPQVSIIQAVAVVVAVPVRMVTAELLPEQQPALVLTLTVVTVAQAYRGYLLPGIAVTTTVAAAAAAMLLLVAETDREATGLTVML